MSDLLSLRKYQEDALLSVSAEWSSGRKRVAIVLATGTGKTVIFSHMTLAHLTSAGSRVLILVHRDELVDQAVSKLHDVATGFKIGVVKGSRNDVNANVIVGSVQTLRRPNRLAQLSNIGLVIVDECHHAAAKSYRDIMTALGCFDDDRPTLALGVTATLSRNDGKALGDVWETVAGKPYDILDGIADGYLCDVSGRLVTVEGLSLGDVAMRGGDFGDGSLSDALTTADARRFVVSAYGEHARDLPGIVFVPSVKAAFDFTEAFAEAGYDVATVWGAMDPDDRKRVLADYRNGRLQILVNCQVLTEGFDAPRAQCAVIARPTTSAALYVQMVGRVLRPYPGKDRALVLDVVGASEDHRLATIADLTTRRIEKIAEGETLREAVERERKRKNPKFTNYVLDVDEFDLFHRSRAVWLQTYAGVWFLPVMNAAVFIWPATEDLYRVGLRPVNRPGGRFIRDGLSLDAALSWGEQVADQYAGAYVESYPGERKDFDRSARASWRRSGVTSAQLREAARIGLRLDKIGDMNRGTLSDMINIHKVSKLLDKG